MGWGGGGLISCLLSFPVRLNRLIDEVMPKTVPSFFLQSLHMLMPDILKSIGTNQTSVCCPTPATFGYERFSRLGLLSSGDNTPISPLGSAEPRSGSSQLPTSGMDSAPPMLASAGRISPGDGNAYTPLDGLVEELNDVSLDDRKSKHILITTDYF